MSESWGAETERPFGKWLVGATLAEMDADEMELLLCPACGAEITATGDAFCGAPCRERWRQQRRERYARPPGALSDGLLHALADALRDAD